MLKSKGLKGMEYVKYIGTLKEVVIRRGDQVFEFNAKNKYECMVPPAVAHAHTTGPSPQFKLVGIKKVKKGKKK